MGAGWAWFRGHRPEEVSGFSRAVVLLGANTVVAGAVAVGLASSLQGHQHHHPGGVAEATRGHHATPAGGASQPPLAPPPAEQGLPVTDMALDTDGDHHQSDPVAPPAAEATGPAPAGTAPAAKPTPPQPEEPDVEADGHQHQHDD